MLVTNWFTFAGVPKTGCCWFKEAMTAAGICFGNYGQHQRGREPEKPTVTIHRDPASWLVSWWANVHGRIANVPILDRLIELRRDDDTFEDFVRRYGSQWPGGIEAIFAHFEADHTLHTERLNDDFGDLLVRLDVPCDVGAVRNLPPVNVTEGKRKIVVPVLTEELRAEIRKAA